MLNSLTKSAFKMISLVEETAKSNRKPVLCSNQIAYEISSDHIKQSSHTHQQACFFYMCVTHSSQYLRTLYMYAYGLVCMCVFLKLYKRGRLAFIGKDSFRESSTDVAHRSESKMYSPPIECPHSQPYIRMYIHIYICKWICITILYSSFRLLCCYSHFSIFNYNKLDLI